MQPIVNGLKTRYEDRIAFDAIDAATESGSATLLAYRLRGHPSYVIVDGEGNALWSLSGQTSEAMLGEQLEKYAE